MLTHLFSHPITKKLPEVLRSRQHFISCCFHLQQAYSLPNTPLPREIIHRPGHHPWPCNLTHSRHRLGPYPSAHHFCFPQSSLVQFQGWYGNSKTRQHTKGFFLLPKHPKALWLVAWLPLRYRAKDSLEAKVQAPDANEESPSKPFQQKTTATSTFRQSLAEQFLP